MKIINTLLIAAFSLFYAGSSISAPAQQDCTGYVGLKNGYSSALMKAFTSDQMGMYAGEIGAYRLSAQTGDGVSMTRNVEALDTIFLISDQNKEGEFIYRSLWFEMEKSDNLPILGYVIDDDAYQGVEPFNPEHLPPLDMQHAWQVVKERFSSVDWEFSKSLVTVAQVSMVYVAPYACPTVSFLIKRADDQDTTGRCWEYLYDIVDDIAYRSGFVPPCWVKFPTETTVDQCEAPVFPASSFVDLTLCP